MTAKKNQKTYSMMELRDFDAECDKSNLVGFYLITEKKFLLIDDYGRVHHYTKSDTVALTFEGLITYALEAHSGTHRCRIFNVALANVPAFKKAWDAVRKDFVPKFKEGETVAWIDKHYNNPIRAIEYYEVREVIGWSRRCQHDSKKHVIDCYRKCYTETGEIVEKCEDDFTSLEEIKHWQKGIKVVNALKKNFTEEDMTGITIFFKGKTYKL